MLRKLAILVAVLGIALNAGLCLCLDDHGAAQESEPVGHHSHEGQAGDGHHQGSDNAPPHDHGPGEPCSCTGPGEEILSETATSCLTALVPLPGLVVLYADVPATPLPAPLASGPTGSGPPRPADVPLLLRVHRLNL